MMATFVRCMLLLIVSVVLFEIARFYVVNPSSIFEINEISIVRFLTFCILLVVFLALVYKLVWQRRDTVAEEFKNDSRGILRRFDTHAGTDKGLLLAALRRRPVIFISLGVAFVAIPALIVLAVAKITKSQMSWRQAALVEGINLVAFAIVYLRIKSQTKQDQ